jgi:hypothetical protein
VVIFMSVVGCGTVPPERDPARALPADRIGDFSAQGLEAHLVAVLQEHQPQVCLDLNGRTAQAGIEEHPVGPEEPLVVEQFVDPLEFGGHRQHPGGED